MTRHPKRPLPRFHGFYFGVTIGVLLGGIAAVLSPLMAVELGANAFFITYLVFAFLQVPRLTPAHLRAHADETDAPVLGLFLVTLAVVVACAVSLFLLINAKGPADALRLALAVLSVVLSWFTTHTMAAFHYAYEYYDVPEAGTDADGDGVVGGLEFPGKDEPDGTAFVYFSYVLGMTAQTADVNLTSNAMRRLVVVHSVFAFFFNTVIVAATVNLVISLGQ